MMPNSRFSRRHFLRATSLAVGGSVLLAPLSTRAATMTSHSQPKQSGLPLLRMRHLHTGETLEVPSQAALGPRPVFLAELNRFLRDHYSGDLGSMDPGLLDQIRRLQQVLESSGAIEVISGFRSPATNERLRRRGGGGVASRSLHLQGRALDMRMAGVPLATLRDAALDLRAGGVGFYPESNFLHIDTGSFRRWG
jgi:uncharacterized protein YcbK (DUF882 family)